MEFAISQAKKSPPAANKFCVGAVLVDADKGKVLSTGYSLGYPRDYKGDPGTTHIEQCCFLEIADEHNLPEERIHQVLPENTALYTTMEPCNERLSGNMTCVTRILRLKRAIRTVYVGIREPGTIIANNNGQERLEANGVKVVQAFSAQNEKETHDTNGYEFGAGNTNIDPAVLRGPLLAALSRQYQIRTSSSASFEKWRMACLSLTKFASLLSEMHQKSVSPTGKFGFHITTYAGNLPQYVAWEDGWETFFAKSMRQALDLEIKAKGASDEMEVLSEALFEKVIPRLLRPLESDGRSVKPSLVHGDLWYANAGIDVETDQPLVFDACCFFAHNECTF
ncbi:hypothetical protein FBEOM_2152 [Fusarium beomiforme]|uniref:protein-ribulosamine 3-kinase n=1 Tax=Fusarium beomiforme TaxID=44412 RepID=A0A9P5E099_9HYPO|nr:hypothetical protein FBEOM_2152 [Fusarium beomiforme]